jgi:hypothetical protein
MLAFVAAGSSPRAATPGASDSRRVKAAFVVNFLGFAAWPTAKLGPAPAPYVVAVLGDAELAAAIADTTRERASSERTVVVKPVTSTDDALDAHLVFIGRSQASRLPAILRALAGASILTVGDTDGYATDGVAVNLYTLDNRVRIEVNSTAAARAGVHLSSNLMRLARIVE